MGMGMGMGDGGGGGGGNQSGGLAIPPLCPSLWANGGLLDGQGVQTVNVRRSSPYQKPPTEIAGQNMHRAALHLRVCAVCV